MFLLLCTACGLPPTPYCCKTYYSFSPSLVCGLRAVTAGGGFGAAFCLLGRFTTLFDGDIAPVNWTSDDGFGGFGLDGWTTDA